MQVILCIYILFLPSLGGTRRWLALTSCCDFGSPCEGFMTSYMLSEIDLLFSAFQNYLPLSAVIGYAVDNITAFDHADIHTMLNIKPW
jgi:hypothetical protein